MVIIENFEILSPSCSETEALGKYISGFLYQGSFVGLKGELGAGKTALVRGICAGLKVRERVTSPTFVIINEYSGRLPVFHFDVYRLDNESLLEEMGYEEYFYEKKGVVIVEWADKIYSLLPSDYLMVELSFGRDENERKLVFNAKGEKNFEIIKELKNYANIGN